MKWPVYSRVISSPFGPRIAPTVGASILHNGVDIACSQASKVFAPARAMISAIFEHKTGGLTVWLDHGDGLETRYCHLSKTIGRVGDVVLEGVQFALSGGAKGTRGAGCSTGPHLHFGVLRGGVHIDPMSIEWEA